MTKKKMLSILCAVTMVGAFGTTALAQPDDLDVDVDTSFDESFNDDYSTDIDVPISESFQDNSDNSTDLDVPISDSFQDNSDNSTDIDVPIEDSFKIEKNNNRKYMTHTMTRDSYNTYETEDNSVHLNATLAQVATGPASGGPISALGVAPVSDDHAEPLGVTKNELDNCSSFNDWTGINNNVQTVGRHLNGGNLNAIAVGQGFNR